MLIARWKPEGINILVQERNSLDDCWCWWWCWEWPILVAWGTKPRQQPWKNSMFPTKIQRTKRRIFWSVDIRAIVKQSGFLLYALFFQIPLANRLRQQVSHRPTDTHLPTDVNRYSHRWYGRMKNVNECVFLDCGRAECRGSHGLSGTEKRQFEVLILASHHHDAACTTRDVEAMNRFYLLIMSHACHTRLHSFAFKL